MPLVPLRPLMEAAEKHNYAQGAFNVNAVAQAKAVIEMHETFRSPAILQGADLISDKEKPTANSSSNSGEAIMTT